RRAKEGRGRQRAGGGARGASGDAAGAPVALTGRADGAQAHAKGRGGRDRRAGQARRPGRAGTLWRDINPPLLRYLQGRAVWGAEDIAAQTWLDAARAMRRFDGDEVDLRRFVFAIGRRRLVDELRRRARRPEQLMGEIGELSVEDASLGSVDEIDEALMIVGRLPADQADAVLLRVLADLDVAQVAEIMGRSPAAVRLLA